MEKWSKTHLKLHVYQVLLNLCEEGFYFSENALWYFVKIFNVIC